MQHECFSSCFRRRHNRLVKVQCCRNLCFAGGGATEALSSLQRTVAKLSSMYSPAMLQTLHERLSASRSAADDSDMLAAVWRQFQRPGFQQGEAALALVSEAAAGSRERIARHALSRVFQTTQAALAFLGKQAHFSTDCHQPVTKAIELGACSDFFSAMTEEHNLSRFYRNGIQHSMCMCNAAAPTALCCAFAQARVVRVPSSLTAAPCSSIFSTSVPM